METRIPFGALILIVAHLSAIVLGMFSGNGVMRSLFLWPHFLGLAIGGPWWRKNLWQVESLTRMIRAVAGGASMMLPVVLFVLYDPSVDFWPGFLTYLGTNLVASAACWGVVFGSEEYRYQRRVFVIGQMTVGALTTISGGCIAVFEKLSGPLHTTEAASVWIVGSAFVCAIWLLALCTWKDIGAIGQGANN